MSNKKVIIIGAGGHSKVIADIIEKCGNTVYGFLDDNINVDTIIINTTKIKVIGKIEDSVRLQQEIPELEFIIGIGNNKERKKIASKYNLNYCTVIHPSAQIGLDVKIEKGTVIMANAVINSSAQISKHCIINTGSIIEHDNKIEDYVHVSPNATLGGTVNIGECTHIGIGSVVKNNISICSNSVIGAGAVVVKDITKEGTYTGMPAEKMEKKRS